MAEAGNKSTASWILLHDAKNLVAETCQAPGLAEQLLVRWLAAGRVPWRCIGLEGQKAASDPNAGDSAFWVQTDSYGVVVLEIFWTESWARRRPGRYSYAAYRIELARTDIAEALAELLPGGTEQTFSPSPQSNAKTPKEWLADEVKRRREAGNVPKGRGALTQFSKGLAEGMAKAAKAGGVSHTLKPRTVEHLLNDLKLWST